jgi:hypothetical protein
MSHRRRRFKQTQSLQDRLSVWANRAREQASQMPPGSERDAHLKKVRQADVASHLNEWATSSGLRSPK